MIEEFLEEDAPQAPSPWEDAALAAALFAIDPVAMGGVWLRALPGPVRDSWLGLLRRLLPVEAALRRVPLSITDDRLLGGLDLAATLRAGRPVAQRGILVEADGGVVVLAMAERMTIGTGARLAAVLDGGRVVLEREGLAQSNPARLGMVALDEGVAGDERPPACLRDRFAFHLDLAPVSMREADIDEMDVQAIAAARAVFPGVTASAEMLEVLCSTAMALGIDSVRAPLLALRVAQAAAALDGRTEVAIEDVSTAARLVFARRATRVPAPPQQEEGEQPEQDDQPTEEETPEETPSEEEPELDQDQIEQAAREMAEMVIAAAQAAMPADLLSQLRMASGAPKRSQSAGKAGQVRHSQQHGRPIGSRRGELGRGAKLHIIETLKAAAPWQKLRAVAGADPAAPRRIQVRQDDFRIVRFKQKTGTTAIFVVDASGSAALQRLAETKGAVELLLADCYVRRDQVALVAFRGQVAELLLPPTNALARAKRALAALPGGGGTPLAAAIDAAMSLAETVMRAGQTPLLAFLTDGRANIARDGTPGRAVAGEEALAAAAQVRLAGITALLIDTSPRPSDVAREIAAAMNARYLPLPLADATTLSRAVRASVQEARPAA